MAPRTRNKQRKDRRKWMRNQNRSQQQIHHGRDQLAYPIPLHNVSTTSSPRPSNNADNDAGDDENECKGTTFFAPAKFDELNMGERNCYENKNNDRRGDQNLHPPDCNCILRKQSRGKNFFLPQLSSSSTMQESEDSYYCLEISNDISNTRK